MQHLTWRSYLQSKTRQPEFLWRMVIWILAAGIVLGYVADQLWEPGPIAVEQQAEKIAAWKNLRSLAESGAWSELWWSLPKAIALSLQAPGPAFLALLAGCCWFAFLWQAMKSPGVSSLKLWCALVALPLGVLSVWPTLFWSYWQEYAWNLRESKELIPGLRYNIVSVGLREELAKLLCVLPLMPVLLRIRDELTALVVSGCVGLGFAIEENVGYFARSASLDTMGRFLTANPFHITLTGLAGLMLYRTFRNPSGWGPHAVGVFGLLVFAHGLYDAFIDLPALADYGLFTTIVFALVVYQFFRELRDMHKPQGDVISLSATFLLGVSILTASTFIYLSATLGTSVAFDALANGVIGLAVMVYLFLREMPETMVTV